MPSPIGHALGGLAAGWLVQRTPAGKPALGIAASLSFAGLAVAPDVDLLTQTHRGVAHSVGATTITAALVWLVLRFRGRPDARLALACGAAWGSHVLLDWLGTDTSSPFGVMALWPFSTAFYESPLHLFPAISRRVHQPELFWIPNLLALLRELAILGPLAGLVGWVRLERLRRQGSVLAVAAMCTAGAGVTVASAQSADPRHVEAIVRCRSGHFDADLAAVAASSVSHNRSSTPAGWRRPRP
jgi:membrane-bound metal-dependent hydrolase YbcI (DUF457 family)